MTWQMATLRRLALGAALALAGCEMVPPDTPEPAPSKPAATPPPTKPKTSFESERLRAYYAARETRLIRQGKLREDYAPKDAPFGPDDLVRNFRKIALYDEYRADSDTLVAEETVSYLRRWHKPVNFAVHFGASVSPAQRAIDTKEVRRFANRLSSLTKLPFKFTSLDNANFVVLFLNRDEQLSEPSKLAPIVAAMNPSVVHGIETLPDEIHCIAYGITSEDPPRNYQGAVLMIKAEHGPRLRTSCIHEEMTQAMGLANDDNSIRPSIFNDDEEFALLTRHDEFLLKMLYDPRLRDGMTPQSETPVLQQVAQDVMRQSRI